MGAIRKVREIVEIIGKGTRDDIRVQQVTMLLETMLDHPEPVSYADLAKRVAISTAAVSRNVKILGVNQVQDPRTKQWQDKGLHLIKAGPDPYNTRQFVVQLDEGGIELMRKLESIMGK